MKITKQNYEQFLIDFMDGKLDPSLKETLFAFLDEHPEIKAEFDDFEIINTAVDKDVSFELKAKLKKPQITATQNIHKKNYEEIFIASAEGDLTNKKQIELERFITLNPTLAKTYQLCKQTKAQTDFSINYPDKKSLKKYPFYQRKGLYYTASAAASILLLASVFFFNKSGGLMQTEHAQQKQRIAVPRKIKLISKKPIVNISAEKITPNYRAIPKPGFANLPDFIIPEGNIRMLQARMNVKEQLASLQNNFKISAPTPKLNPSLYFVPPKNIEQINYAFTQEDGKNKRIAKSLWNGLFGPFKNKQRHDEDRSDNKNTKKISPLWVLANIGLERVNEVTGTNMRLNPKSEEGKNSRNHENKELEKTKSAN